MSVNPASLRRAVLLVAIANLAYFFIEGFVALHIGSVSLLADSADFFEDAAVNILIFFAVVWTAQSRARVGKVLALILLLPAAAFLWTATQKLMLPVAPEAFALTMTGMGALVVNLSCASILATYRNTSGSLTKAAFLSSRNDAIANVGIVAAGLVTAFVWQSAWPDLIVGCAIAWLNIDAAKEIWEAARSEGEHAA